MDFEQIVTPCIDIAAGACSDPEVAPAVAAAVRLPAAAGVLYPAEARALGGAVEALLARVPAPHDACAHDPPKALIVPHGGLRHSGSIAATAYRLLRPVAARIRRVVLLGPAHRRPPDGLVVPAAHAFATPLGRVPVDAAAVLELLALPFVGRSDAPHRREHSLEMQLPFLQSLLGAFTIVPVVAGAATAPMVEAVLERLWGGPETLIVASTDLSRFRRQCDAHASDTLTAARIARGEDGLGESHCCASGVVDGLLRAVRGRRLHGRVLDLGNSGDTGGDPARVVGYGAFAFA